MARMEEGLQNLLLSGCFFSSVSLLLMDTSPHIDTYNIYVACFFMAISRMSYAFLGMITIQ